MAFEKSGVEFVAKGVGAYISDINRANKAQQSLAKSASGFTASFGQASGSIGGFGSRLSSLIPGIGGFGSALGNIAQIAGGIVVANVFGKIAEGVGAFVSTGLEAVGNAQQLEVGLGALLTQNNLYERAVTTTTVAVGDFAKAQAEASEKAKDLRADIAYQQATIQEQKERIRQVTAQWGENGLETQQQIARLGQMERELEKTSQELAGLSDVQQEYTTVTSTSYEQVRDFGEAQRLAAEQSKELLAFVDKLSIVSPFEQEQVQLVTKFAVGAGLAVDEVKNFTTGFLDLAAATGIGSAELAFASDQLLQVAKVGKITQIDLKQLRRLGIDLEKIIGVEMGMNIEQFNAEAAKSPEIFNTLFNSVASFSEKTFGGAAQRMATTVSGLQSTLSDIFKVGAKNLLRPLVEAAGPVAADMLSRLSDVVTGPQLAAIGEEMGLKVAQGLEIIGVAVNKIMAAFNQFGLRGAAVSILGMLGLDQDQVSGVMGAVDTITEAITKITGAFERFGLKGATVSIAGMLGLDPATIGTLFTTIEQVQTSITTFIDNIFLAFERFGASGATMSILGQLGLSSDQIVFIFDAAEMVNTAITSIVDSVVTNWPVMQAAAQTTWLVLQGIFNGIIAAVAPAVSQLTASFQQVGVALNGLGVNWSTVWDAIVLATGIVAAGIAAAIVGIIGVVSGLASGLASGITAAIEMFMLLSTNIKTIIEGLTTTFAGWTNFTTALLQGDFAAAWEGFKLMLEGVFIFWKGITDAMQTAFLGAVNVVTSTIEGFVTGIIGYFETLYNTLVGHSIVPDMINEIVQWFSQLPSRVVGVIKNLAKMAIEPFQEMWDEVSEIFNPENWMVLGEGIIDGVIEGIEENADKVLELLKAMALDALQGVMDALGMHSPSTVFAEVGANIIQGLVVGIDGQGDSVKNAIARQLDFTAGMFIDFDLNETERNAAEDSIKAVFDMMYQQVADGTAGVSELMAQFRAELVATGEFNEQEISEAMSAVNFQEIVDTIRSQFGPLTIELKAQAVALAQSFSGIASSFATMLQDQMGSLDEARKIYEDFAKENQKLTDTIAKQMESLASKNAKLQEMQGELAKLAADYQDDLLKGLDKLANLETDLQQALASQAIAEQEIALKEETLAGLQDELLATTLQYGENSEEAEKVREKIRAVELALEKARLKYSEITQKVQKANQAIRNQKKFLEDLKAAYEENSAAAQVAIQNQIDLINELTQALDDNKKAQENLKKLSLDEIFETLTQGHGGIEPFAKITDQIAALEAFLASSETALTGQVWDDALGEWVNWSLDRNTAQVRLNELLEEQAALEEQIRQAQEQQQQLAFLQQQISLMKLIADQGLDPAEILGGITLGLGASMEDLLGATSAVVQAMIDQINADLQISSPSKVMAKIGGRVMQGLAAGVAKGEGMLDRVVSSIPLLSASMSPLAAPAFGGGDTNSTTNYNFPMTVNTSATPQGVIQQYEVRRGMAGV